MGDVPLERIERLERRVEQLEAELGLARGATAAATRPTVGAQPAWTPPKAMPPWPGPVLSPTPPVRHREPIHVDSEDALKWGGVGLVVLAVGFAVSTAISRGWIGPELQLAGAAAVSVALVVVGLRLRPTRPAWTHALCGAGIAAAYTTVASNLFLDQASDEVAFVSTVAIGLAGFGLARLVPSEWVAAVALAGGGVGWLVIAGSEPPVLASLVWFVALVAIALGLSLEQAWFALRLAAHIVGLLITLRLADEAIGATEQIAVLAAAVVLAGSFVTIPAIGDLTSIWQQLEVQLTLAVGVWAFGVIALAFDLEDDTVLGSVAISVAVGTGVIAMAIRRRTRPAHFVSLVIGASVILSVGFTILLSTAAGFVALAVQGAGLFVLSRSLGGNLRVTINAAAVSVIAALYTVGETLDAWTFDVAWSDDLAHLAIIVATAVAGWQTRDRAVQRFSAVAVLAMLLIWLGSVLVHLPQGQAAVSVSWAVVGTLVLVAGAVRKVPELGAIGLAVLALTVGKLLTVDLREVDTLWRAGLFFVVGLGFLRLGFLLPRLTGRAADPPANDQPRSTSGHGFFGLG